MDAKPAELARHTALILLAAGQARRFGSAKLKAELSGIPLVHHAALTFAKLPFAHRLCVTTQGGAGLSAFGFETVEVEQGLPMSRSIAAGAERAEALGVDAALIALGDMPNVQQAHIERMMTSFNGSAIASSRSGVAMPPAIFGRSHFADLIRLEGDAGARVLLASAPLIEADAQQLIDIDTPADLVAAQALGVGRSG